ncbi:LysR family transcriptional regulator [Zavarzinia sp.]|uniref:LysR family transcriptional regulator n=1 Tax=Zavarzinia sp. TaxID=2027920 RepID=UPI003564DF4C
MTRSLTYLHYLPAFEAVARLGGIRAAADELNLSASAVSLQIKKLGEATGIALFEKTGRGVALTRAGADFAQAVAVSLGQLEGAAGAARRIDMAAPAVSLGVSVPTALGIAWLSGVLVEFAEGRNIPELTINEAVTGAEVDWERNDVAIVYDNPPFPGKSWHLLSAVRLRTVCAPVLFPKLDLQQRERKLGGITLFHEDDGAEWAKWAVEARVSLQGSRRVRVGSVAQAVASAVQGRGLALVSDMLTRGFLAEGRLIQPFLASINAAHEYYILCPEERAEDPLLRALVDHVTDHLRPKRA